MTAHKQAEILKAYADNTDLVMFLNDEENLKWIRTNSKALMDYSECEFFACLPQHNENGQCLRWLNGLDCIISFESVKDVCGLIKGDGDKEWRKDCGFMNENATIQIKPRKEKRWVAVCNSGYNCIDKLFDSKNQAKGFVTAFYPNNRVDDFQLIEIEVEV